MKIILEKFFHAQKWKNTLLAGCFIFIAAFNLWQIFGNDLGYANNGSFNKYVNSNGLAFVKTPEYYFFSDPVNYRVVASPERRKLINSADAVVRLTLPLAKLNKNIFDLRWSGCLWFLMFLSGIGLILYECRRIKNAVWFCLAASGITSLGVYPVITAYFASLYMPGVFFGTFVLYLGLCLKSIFSPGKIFAAVSFVLQVCLLFIMGFTQTPFAALTVLFWPFSLWCFCQDVVRFIPLRPVRFWLVSVLSVGLLIGSVSLFLRVFKYDSNDFVKFNFYIRYVLPFHRDVKFLGKRNISAQETEAIRKVYFENIWTAQGVFNKYFKFKIQDWPQSTLFLRTPKLFVKSLKMWHISSHREQSLQPANRPGMVPRLSADQKINRPLSVFYMLSSRETTLLFSALSFLLLIVSCMTCYCWNKPSAKAVFFNASLCAAPVVFAFYALSHAPTEEFFSVDVAGFLLFLALISQIMTTFSALYSLPWGKRFEKIPQNLQVLSSEVCWILWCVICTALMEFIFHGTVCDNVLPVGRNFYFECALVLILMLPFRILLGRKGAAIIVFTAAVLWGFSNKVKSDLTGKPLLPDEFVSFKHVWETSVFVLRSKAFYFAAALLAAGVFVVYKAVKSDFQQLKKRWILRLVLLFVSFGMIYYTFFRMPLPEKLFPAAWTGGTVLELFREDGLLNRFMEHSKRKMVAPSQDGFAAFEKELPAFKAQSGNFKFDQNFKPDVIFVLNEAAFDPAKLGGLKFPGKSPFPIADLAEKLRKNAEHTVKTGKLKVPVMGGTTVNSEFEVMTGISSFISPQLPYNHVSLNKVPSVASHLKQRGYRTSFLHPYTLALYSRRSVLPNLGIDQLFDETYFPRASGDFPFYPDAPFYDRIVNHLHENKGQPQFMLCVSIQNHGPYNTPRFRHVPVPEFSVRETISDGDRESLRRYLAGISLSYQALNSFFERLQKEIRRPTVVVVFGDHLPSFDGEKIWNTLIPGYTRKKAVVAYETEYLVWANYPMPHSGQFRREMKAFELGKRSAFASGALPFDQYIYLFDKLKHSPMTMGENSTYNNMELFFNGVKIENEFDRYLRIYHVLCYKDFAGK